MIRKRFNFEQALPRRNFNTKPKNINNESQIPVFKIKMLTSVSSEAEEQFDFTQALPRRNFNAKPNIVTDESQIPTVKIRGPIAIPDEN